MVIVNKTKLLLAILPLLFSCLEQTYQLRKKNGLIRKNLFAGLVAVSSFIGASHAHAAIIRLDYPLSGGAVFLSASGTASALVSYSVFGTSHTQLVTGIASGATSWNIAGDMRVTVDDTGSIATQPNLMATRRAGTINISFPVLNLGPVNFDLSATLRSNNSQMDLVGESGALINSTDWLVPQAYSLPTGLFFALSLGSSAYEFALVQYLYLTNEPSLSSAALAAPIGSTSGAFLNDSIQHGCVAPIFGECAASIDNIAFNFSGVNFTTASIAATGSSTTLLPTIVAATVPIPGTAWLFGLGLAGLIGVGRRKKRALVIASARSQRGMHGQQLP